MPGPRTKEIKRTKPEISVQEPKMYRVILLNDDVTTMEFVVRILKTIFNRKHAEARKIMLSVHNTGAGVAGTYTRDIAATKVAAVEKLATAEEFPLKTIMEPEE